MTTEGFRDAPQRYLAQVPLLTLPDSLQCTPMQKLPQGPPLLICLSVFQPAAGQGLEVNTYTCQLFSCESYRVGAK